MAKLDYSASTQVPAIELKCEQIKDKLLGTVAAIQPVLQQVRNLVRGDRAAIIAEMGVDKAQALLAVYTALKNAVDAANDSTTEDLPEA